MQRVDRRTGIFYMAAAAVIVFAFFFDTVEDSAVSSFSPMFRDSLRLLRHMLLFLLVLGWVYSIKLRVIDRLLQHYMVMIGLMMRIWLVLRMFKWEFAPAPSLLHRHLWYMYYIPLLLIPTYGAVLADSLSEAPAEGRSARKKLLFLISLLLMAGVLTNDLHHQVFAFPNGILLYDSVYTYGWLYYVVFAWIICLGTYFAAVLIRTSRVPGLVYRKYIPLVLLGVGFLYWILFIFDASGYRRDADVVALICVAVMCIIETAVTIGLLPSNTRYGTLFSRYIHNVWIVDEQFRIIYRTEKTGELSPAMMKQAAAGQVELGDAVLCGAPIRGGFVLWLTDLSRTNSYLHALREKESLLQGEADLLQAELSLKQEETRNAENAQIFEQIGVRLAPQFDLIEGLLQEGKKDPVHLPESLRRVCVPGAFIKRYSNLLLLCKDREELQAEELFYCIRETAGSLETLGLEASVEGRCQGLMNGTLMAAGYRYVEQILEQVMDAAEGCGFTFREAAETAETAEVPGRRTVLVLLIRPQSGRDFSGVRAGEEAAAFERSGGTIRRRREGEEMFLTLAFPLAETDGEDEAEREDL